MPGVAITDVCCDNCRLQKTNGRENVIGFLPGIVLALLPKCPFCFMAFSGTMVLCGSGEMVGSRTFTSTVTMWISGVACLLVLASFLLSRRKKRKVPALVLGGTGVSAICYSVMAGGGYLLYYSGVILVFGSLLMIQTNLFFLFRKTGFYSEKLISAEPG